MRLHHQFAWFAAGGLLGLIVDAGVVQWLVAWAQWNPYLARVPSFLLAATVTWWWNRRHTFAGHASGRPRLVEWLHWLALMGVGALFNYGLYAILVLLFEPMRRWPAAAAAIGSAVAALVNFSSARRMLFPGSRSPV